MNNQTFRRIVIAIVGAIAAIAAWFGIKVTWTDEAPTTPPAATAPAE